MGIRSSKNRTSYDIAPVVSDKDFSYKKNARTLPNLELPVVIVTSEEEQSSEVQHIQATSVEVESLANNDSKSETSANNDSKSETSANNDSKSLKVTQDSRIPSWVNELNFKKLLTQSNPDIKEIVTFEAYPALAAGENFSTLMLRVKITAKFQNDTTKDFSFMLKVPHDNKEMKEMLQAMNFFIVENAVYTDVIPVMEDMYRQAGVDVTFGAKTHQLPTDESNIHYVLLDDLGLDGFRNANRLECLNMDHTLLVLRKLAQFHAASACHAANNGAYSELYSPDMDNEIARNMMNQMFLSFKKPFMDNLKHHDNGEKCYDAMEKFFDNIVEEFIYLRKPRPDYLNVLNHGDLWSNNILFKYDDDGNVKEALLVDFQNTNWGSPAQDLFYFIISSIQIDIKLSQYEYFIRYYHQHLTENLNLLKYSLEIPSLKALHMQMIQYGSWATATSFLTLGVVLLEPADNAKFENFMGDSKEGDDLKNAMYTNERYRKYINEILPWLHNHGFMEMRSSDLDNKTLSTDKLVPQTTIAATIVEQKSEQLSTSYPEWVNESLFEDVIRADFENYQKTLKFAVSPATSVGDNYSSVILKVDIDIELTDNTTHNLSYMLKIPPNGKQAKAIITMLSSFEKEIAAYYKIIPQFENLYKQQAGIDVVFGPKSYKLNKDIECDAIVLENLRVKGFKNCERLDGLDMQHTKAVLKKLAEFHAASAYLYATQGKFPEVFERSMYTEETKENREKITKPYMKIFTECVEQYENKEEYIDNVRDYGENSTTHLIKAYSIDWNKFNVLNHGDCWTNNIMFQYDDKGDISNTYFVDYQLVKYCSPAYDLYYFLLSSPKLELKLEQFDYFIRYYHENLKVNLELLKYPNDIPTLKELHIELLDYGTFAMTTVMGVMSVVLLDPTDTANLENMLTSDEEGIDLKKQMFLNKRYRTHAEAIYPWLNRRGILNFK